MKISETPTIAEGRDRYLKSTTMSADKLTLSETVLAREASKGLELELELRLTIVVAFEERTEAR